MLRHTLLAAVTMLGVQAIGSAAADPAQPAAATGAAQANSSVTQSRTIGSWTVRCYRTTGAACDVSQIAYERQQNQRVLGIAIAFMPERNIYSGRFVVPLVVSFAKGMTIRIGAYELANLKYRRCERDGCYVEGALPPQMIEAMTQSGAAKGSIEIAAVNGKTVRLPIALDGFADSLAQMKQWDAQRSAPLAAKP
jgi:invasion protein IalB